MALLFSAEAQFAVKNDEMHKTGFFTIEQEGIPLEPDYKEIHRHVGRDKINLNPAGKFIVLKHMKAKWKIYVPDTYKQSMPPGVLIISNGLDEDGTSLITKCKYAAKKYNLILIDPEFQNLPENNNIVQADNERRFLIRRSPDIIKERYKIDEDRIFLFGTASLNVAAKTAIICPDTFKMVICQHPFLLWYDNMPINGVDKPSFGSVLPKLPPLRKPQKIISSSPTSYRFI
jgi:hypothetical protein